jgi:dUTP pyrophosphatase
VDYLKFNVKRLTETAQLPTQANKSDAGWDLYADERVEIWPGNTVLISTGISLEIPDGYVGLIWDRSSVGVKGVHRHAGVIDSGYRGEVKVCLHNSNHSPLGRHLGSHMNESTKENLGVLLISKGDRIAQILFQEAPVFQLEEIEALGSTQRGAGGFGSSGK